VSRLYRTGYNALAVLVMMSLSLLPSLTPFQGKRSRLELQSYSVFKVLFCFPSFIIKQKHQK